MTQHQSEDTIFEVREIFRSFLKENGHRQTPERFMVLEEIYRNSGHFDADDIYFKMKNTGSRVSRATVYNTLELLVECGLVQRHQFGQNQSYYERAYAYQQHDHIICNACGSVLEFCDPRIHEIKMLMEKIHGFRINNHSLHFYGTCNDPKNCTIKDTNKPGIQRELTSGD
jgi:Fur family transcriptional regulator, ferric uptake regulator